MRAILTISCVRRVISILVENESGESAFRREAREGLTCQAE